MLFREISLKKWDAIAESRDSTNGWQRIIWGKVAPPALCLMIVFSDALLLRRLRLFSAHPAQDVSDAQRQQLPAC